MPSHRTSLILPLATLLIVGLTPLNVGAAHFVVTHAGDSPDPNPGDSIGGDSSGCTLRAALDESNALLGPDTITFSSGLARIDIRNGTLELVDSGTVIHGQSGSPTIDGLLNTYNSPLFRMNSNGHISGLTIRRSRSHGIEIIGRDNRIGGDTQADMVIIGSSGLDYDSASGVWIHGAQATDNVVAGCYIGTTANGGTMDPNPCGITISTVASDNRIGSSNGSVRTLVSGNLLTGIRVTGNAAHNQILNCIVGTDITGARSLPNGLGGLVIDRGAHHNRIGGDTIVTRNLISGNQAAGIIVRGSETIANSVAGNMIGLDATGTLPLGNKGPGILIHDHANKTIIGDTALFPGNVISGNDGDGIRILGTGADSTVVLGNFIGVDTSGYASIGNGWQSGHGIYIGGEAAHTRIGGVSSTEGNVISGNLGSGVFIHGSDSNEILGNLIGVSVGSISSAPNAAGVTLRGGSSFNTIGRTDPGAGNVISGNRAAIFPLGTGVAILGTGSDSNRVVGNMIGADYTGTRPLRNGSSGVLIGEGARYNIIGGSTVAERNIIAGNGFGTMTVDLGIGVHLFGEGTCFNVIRGNYVGVGIDGISPVLNLGNGIGIYDGATNNTIGGATDQDANLIVANRAFGVYLTDTVTMSNAIRNNRIYSNDSAGIIIRHGAQRNIAPPVLTRARPDSVSGSSAAIGGTVDIYRAAPDPGGFGEGLLVVGNAEVDATGHFAADVVGVSIGDTLTALVTDTAGSTSQFSQNVIVQDPLDADDAGTEPALPSFFTLAQNYPNPFNPSTVIEYDIPTRTHVTIEIFNLLGQSVCRLIDESMSAGTHRVKWNGTDHSGNSAANGVYLYRIRTDVFTASKKMLLLK